MLFHVLFFPGDIYSFSIILYEIYSRSKPYDNIIEYGYHEIVDQVMHPDPGKPFKRPDVKALEVTDVDYKCPDYVRGESL